MASSSTNTDTCVVRPELMEFEKFSGTNNSSLFLSLVAHPDTADEPASFKFTKRGVTSVAESDVAALDYSAENLADLRAQQLFVSNIESDRIANVSNMYMAPGGVGTFDLSQGNITQVTHMDFHEDGASTFMQITNDHIKFGESEGVLDLTDGNLINVKNLNFSPDSVSNFNDGNVVGVEFMSLTQNTGVLTLNGGTLEMHGGLIDMADGNIANITYLEIGDMVLHDANKIDNLQGNSVVLEGVHFKNQDVTQVQNLVFTGDTAVVDMTDGTMTNVSTLNMNSAGTGLIDMKVGDIKNVERLDFGETLKLTTTPGELPQGAPYIFNPVASGHVDIEGVLFNTKTVSAVDTVTFTPGAGGVLDMSDGTVNNLQIVNMTQSGVFNMNLSNIDNLENLQMNKTFTAGTFEVDGPTSTIQHNNGGVVTLEGVQFQDQTMTEMKNQTFVANGEGTLNMNHGNVDLVHYQTMSQDGVLMMSQGRIDFSAAGSLEMIGDATANIGLMHLGTDTIKNTSPDGVVKIEDSIFNGTQLRTLNINKFTDQASVFVENTEFAGDDLTVTNVHTDVISAKLFDGPLDVKSSIVNFSKVNSPDAIRLTNVSAPVNPGDVANRAWVLDILSQSASGLKPRKAVECSIFGGNDYLGSDLDVAEGSAFGAYTKYAIEFTPIAPVDGIDQSELRIHLQGDGSSPVTIDGFGFNQAELDEIANSGNPDGTTGPSKPRKRVLLMGINETSIPATATGYDDQTTFAGAMLRTDPKLKGLNGIWEIQTLGDHQDQNNFAGWRTLYMKRSADMNETTEVLSGTYAYVKFGQSRKDYGFVVSSKDPLRIGDTDPNVGLTVDGNTNQLIELQWVELNNLNFELNFVNDEGTTKELLPNVASTFRKGGLAMKYEATDDKQIMVNADLLRFESDDTAEGGLALHVNGNIDFSLNALDQHINAFSDDYSVFVNSSRFEKQGNISNAYIDQIFANQVVCESDSRLKTEVTPLTDGLDFVNKLEPVQYRWVDEAKGTLPEMGFIAQSVEAIFPSLVQTNQTTGIKALEYPKLTSVLTKAIQELSAKVAMLEAKLDEKSSA